MPAGQVLLFIIGTIAIIAGAYYATAYISKLGTKMTGRKSGRHIILRERFALSKDKSFCIVEIHGKVYVVGITNQSMTLLDTLDADAVIEDVPAAAAKTMSLGAGFAAVLASRGWPKKSGQSAQPEDKPADAPNDEEGAE